MAFTPSIAIIFLIVVASSIVAGSPKSSDSAVHDGKCPSNNLFIHIHCRRRVCRPEELTPLCVGDSTCPTTHKCCRTMCSCRDRCVEAVLDN